MSNTLDHNHPVIKRVYLYLFALTFLLLLIFLIVYLFMQNNSSQSSEVQNTPSQTTSVPATPKLKMIAAGSMSLLVKNAPDSRVAVGVPFTLSVMADSPQGKDIAGFDVLISKDASMKAGTATTTLTGFQISSSSKNDHMSYTAFKSPSVTTPTSFTKSAILSVPFTPSVAGVYTFSILPQSGSETTKMVDSSSQPVMFSPQVSTLKVTVH